MKGIATFRRPRALDAARSDSERQALSKSPREPLVAAEIQGLEKTYNPGAPNEHVALSGIDLNISANEFFTLLGPSGCGKTTLLRILGGFEQLTKGECRIFGTDVSGLPPEARPVNTVFQQYALFPHMTVRRNIGFGLDMLGTDNDAGQSDRDAVSGLARLAFRRGGIHGLTDADAHHSALSCQASGTELSAGEVTSTMFNSSRKSIRNFPGFGVVAAICTHHRFAHFAAATLGGFGYTDAALIAA